MLNNTELLEPTEALKLRDHSDPFHSVTQYLSTKTLVKNSGYHRSKIYNPTHGMNPLVTACQPLFTLISRIDHSPKDQANHAINITLWEHEIQAMVDCLAQYNYSKKVIASARFSMMVLIDEKSRQWSKTTEPTSILLPSTLNTLQISQLFFDLMTACTQDESQHIDLIELFYLCLQNGYAGHYAQQPQGLHQLSKAQHHLFTIIQSNRPTESIWCRNHPPPQPRSCMRSRPLIIAIIILTPLFILGQYTWHHHPIHWAQWHTKPPMIALNQGLYS